MVDITYNNEKSYNNFPWKGIALGVVIIVTLAAFEYFDESASYSDSSNVDGTGDEYQFHNKEELDQWYGEDPERLEEVLNGALGDYEADLERVERDLQEIDATADEQDLSDQEKKDYGDALHDEQKKLKRIIKEIEQILEDYGLEKT